MPSSIVGIKRKIGFSSAHSASQTHSKIYGFYFALSACSPGKKFKVVYIDKVFVVVIVVAVCRGRKVS